MFQVDKQPLATAQLHYSIALVV